MKVLAAILLFLIVLVLELYLDYKAYLRHKGVRHKSKPLRRFLMLLPSIVLFTAASPWPWYFAFPFVCKMLAVSWWLLFDGLYNVIRNFNWWFTGGHRDPTEPDDSKLDIFLSKLSVTQQAILKIGAVAISLSVYIITLLKN